MRRLQLARPFYRASTIALAGALLFGCGGAGDSGTAVTEQPLSVQLSETATTLSVKTELSSSSGRTKFEAQALNFLFDAKIDSGPNVGYALTGRLELKGEREDDGVTKVEGRLYPDALPSMPTRAELKDEFEADRKALKSALRADITVLVEELKAASANGAVAREREPSAAQKQALETFKAKFSQRVSEYNAALSARIAEYRAARRNSGSGGDDDDNTAKGYEVHGTIDADGAVDLTLSIPGKGNVRATGTLTADGSARGDFIGPARGDKGHWSADATGGIQPPAPPPSSGNYEAGLAKYMASCSACHSAGKVDTSGTAGDLAGESDDLVSNLGRIDRAMSGLTLTAQEILDLKAFLRAANAPPSSPPPPPPPPPPPSTSCASQDLTWTQGTATCNATYAGGASGSTLALSDSVAPTTGGATASCTNGVLTLSAQTCTSAAPPPPPPPPASCASQAVTWTQGSATCNATYAGGASGSTVGLSDSVAPTTGSATASCTNGVLTLSAQTCAAAVPPPTGTFAAGQAKYTAACASCHKAGTFDTAGAFADLKGKGGMLVTNLGTISGAMNGITLTAQEVLDLQALLSAVP